jgi:mannose-6-phosphate isomerase
MPAPVALRPDNFTPPARTPWGGTRLLARYKPGVVTPYALVGESWEVSVEPTFPSLTRSGERLDTCVARDPVAWLGEEDAARFAGQTPLLVKLLDAADNLSVQVHPADDDPSLAPDESGKPESWVVLDAEPGAGLYLGFREGVGRDDVARLLAENGRIDALMNFVPVRTGDAFVIDAGTPHAIGAGVTLLEPQFVRPGRRGLTYRYWDWNRRYDAAGNLDPRGALRPLHVARSLDVTRWDRGGGDGFVARCRATEDVLERGAVERRRVVSWSWFQVERWVGMGRLVVETEERLLALTCVGGRLEVACERGSLTLGLGESALVPACAGRLAVDLSEGDVFAVRT